MKTFVAIERTTAMSSAMPAMCGRHSETQVPARPWRANLNFGPRNVELGLMNAAR